MNRSLKLKVCGMRDAENIMQVAHLNPHYMGFIFYPKSPRFVADLAPKMIHDLKIRGIVPVAVCVNETFDSTMAIVSKYGFDHLQLHGSETAELCQKLKSEGLSIIKAFSVAEPKDLEVTVGFEKCCDYFLFDTKTRLFGGSGQSFNWEILNSYQGSVPFFLSGGIGPGDVEKVRAVTHQRLYCLDLNSRFELEPALKDVSLLKKTMDQILH